MARAFGLPISILVSASLAAFAGVAGAQTDGGEPAAGKARETLLFDEVPIVFSATRTERSALDVPNAATIITSDEIRASGATTLAQVLATVPGLEVLRLTAGDYNLSARGFNGAASSNLLVMIDGRSTYVDFFGVVNWESLNVALQDIERIEVIRGPGSSLFGANAFLGTVNIVTKAVRDLPTLYVRGGGGPEGALITATGAHHAGRTGVKASLRYRAQDHFRNPDSAALNVRHDRDETALRSRLLNTAIEHEFPDGSELRLGTGVSDHDGDILTGVGTWLYSGPTWFAELDYSRGPWTVQAWLNRLDLDLFNLTTAVPAPVPISDRLVSNVADFEVQREISISSHELLIGATARRLSTRSPDILGDREAETLYAGFAQDEYAVTDNVLLFLGARFDEHPKSGFHVSPRGGVVIKLGESSRLRFAASSSFRNPTQIQNYTSLSLQTAGPLTVAQVVGDDRLDPVRVVSYEAGFQRRFGRRLGLKLDGFYQVIKDPHDFALVAPGPPAVLSFRNSRRAESYGAEASIDFRWSDALRGFLNYSYQSAHGPGEGITPRQKASAGLRGALGRRLRYALTGSYVGHHEVEADSSVVLAEDDVRSRLLVDGFLGLRLHRRFELGVHARNLFHQTRRQEARGDEIGSELLVTGTIEF